MIMMGKSIRQIWVNVKETILFELNTRGLLNVLSHRNYLHYCFPQCFIDGPYGTGTREVFNAEHAVLIGSGIGVTPMASILQSVWYRFNASRQVCPSCAHTWYREEDITHMNLNKV